MKKAETGSNIFKLYLIFLWFFIPVIFILLFSFNPLQAAVAAEKKPVSPPSVLLITLDTTRADHLGCYGAAFAATPNLDELARSGTRFDRAFSPVPLTLPSHASILTGLVPRRHGVRDNALFRLEKSVPVLMERLKQAGYQTVAFVSSAVLDRVVGLDRGFDIYDDRVRIGDRTAFNYEERAASQVTDAALVSIDSLKPPFFFWVHYFDPHLPYVPPEPFRSQFKGHPYDGEIAFMDQQIGRLIKAVRTKADRLLIIAAGDHGESLGEHGESAHDVFLYNATLRVPLILSGPDIPSGKVVDRNVGLIDIAPTTMDLLGLSPLSGTDGQSLLPVLKAKKSKMPDYEMESFFPHFSYGWSPLRALVRKNYKYIQAPRPELYDLTTDPAEMRNLIDSNKKMAQEMTKSLDALTKNDLLRLQTGDPELLEQRRRLESLGYVGAGTVPPKEAAVDPKDGILWIENLETARKELRTGDPKKGIPLLEELLKKSPDNIPAILVLSQCYLAAGEQEQSIALARRAISLNPENDVARYNLANALIEKENIAPDVLDQARSEFDAVLAINPRHADAYLSYANLLVMQNRAEDAYLLLQRARQSGVEDPDIETKIGLLEMTKGAAGDAKAAFEKAVALYPRSSKALEGLGRIAYAQEDYYLAAHYYARALESVPSAHLAKTLGSIFLHELDDVRGARRAFQKALELTSPNDPDYQRLHELLASLADIK